MSVRTVAIVQARMGSARLPGKSLLPLAGSSLIAHVLRRAMLIGVDEVVLATSLSQRDDALTAEVRQLGFRVWQGSEHDVLGRFVEAASVFGADVIMRVTGDCPLLAPDVCRRVLSAFNAGRWMYVSNDTTCSGYPDGTDCEVMTREGLDRASAAAMTQSDREHVTSWVRRCCETECHTVLAPGRRWTHVKLSVDTAADLEFVREVYGLVRFGETSYAATMAAVEMALAHREGVQRA